MIFLSFKNKAKSLKELDMELVNTNSTNENKTMSLLIEYNTLLVDSYPTFTCIYKKYQRKLNIAWYQRITSYDKVELKKDFELYIKNDLTKLLSLSKNPIHNNFKIIGSYLDDSFVNGNSDLDILLVFHNEDGIEAKNFYNDIFEILKIKFHNAIVQSIPSFIIRNFSDIALEITPCIDIGNGKYKKVIIDNENYKFDEICPDKYFEYFKKCNAESEGLFYSLSKEVIKCKYRECFSILSFYLKIFLSEFINEEGSDKSVLGFYKKLMKVKLKDIENPVDKKETLEPCSNEEKKGLTKKIQKFIKKSENEQSK